MNRYLLHTILLLSISLPNLGCAQTSPSVSTKIEQVRYYDHADVLKDPCKGKIGKQFNSYISLSVDKMFVRKEDGALKAVFDSKRTSYPVAKFSATFADGELKVNKITELTNVYGSTGTADLIGGWSLLDRLPYTFTKPSIQLIIASNSESNIKNAISMFNTVTAAVPDLQVSASVNTAGAIASAFDTFFLAPDRTVNAMKTEYDFPLSAGNLCEGAYIVFAAKKPETYAQYVPADLTVKGSVATFKNQPINNISHAIVRIKINDRYYETPSSALEDNNKKWAAHFNKLSTTTSLFFSGVTKEKIDQFKSHSSASFLLGEEYLMNDPYLLLSEKIEILELIKANYLKKLAVLEQSLTAPVTVPNQTVQVLNQEANNSFEAPKELQEIIEDMAAGNVTLPKVPNTLTQSFRTALNSTSGVIQERFEAAAAQRESDIQ